MIPFNRTSAFQRHRRANQGGIVQKSDNLPYTSSSLDRVRCLHEYFKFAVGPRLVLFMKIERIPGTRNTIRSISQFGGVFSLCLCGE